ncbi:KS1 protein-like [Clytia hemisphaerica]|uniref:Uncharacterized protein n=1 Tax=Clytia hemisphaerica TaxID=252671 RepID=A0A7M5XBZ1_9CNID|eukprot:TCONS_00071483-protein
MKISLLVLVLATLVVADRAYRDDIRELKKLDQNILYDMLKDKRLYDHVDFDDETKKFLTSHSKDELRDIMDMLSADEDEDEDTGDDKELEEEKGLGDKEMETRPKRKETLDENKKDNDNDEDLDEVLADDADDFDEEDVRHLPKEQRDPWWRGRRRRRFWRTIAKPFKHVGNFVKKHHKKIVKGVVAAAKLCRQTRCHRMIRGKK